MSLYQLANNLDDAERRLRIARYRLRRHAAYYGETKRSRMLLSVMRADSIYHGALGDYAAGVERVSHRKSR